MQLADLICRDDLSSYDSRAHSVRLSGVVTSIRLENLYWAILAELSEAKAMTTSQLISTLYEEMLEVGRAVPNLASLLRVTCLRYLSLKVSEAARVQERRAASAPALANLEEHKVWSGRRNPERLAGEAGPD